MTDSDGADRHAANLAHTVDHADGEVTIVLAGEVDASSGAHLRDVLFDALAGRPARITVDVRGLVFIDSTGIGTLIAARQAARRHGCRFVVTNTRGQVRRVLSIAGVLAALTTAGSHRDTTDRPGRQVG
ncbi:STAS domain-containing protein [Planosporangium sp. 12N6]|uniref:STAS domain-containing protein n=1 Tax=Planosporangium spinosum TaxID=3402278 RepID=UPI003CEDD655